MPPTGQTRVTFTLYRALLRAGKKWVALNKQGAQTGPREAQTFLQDIAFRSVKANSTSWASTLLPGMSQLYAADKYLSHSCQVALHLIRVALALACLGKDIRTFLPRWQVGDEKGSANYFGLEGLKFEFRRALTHDESLDERLDRGFDTLKYLNLGNQFAESIYNNLEPREKPSNVAFSVGDILYHKEFGWRGVVYGWTEKCEMGEDWVKRNGADDKKDFPFYFLLCNDGKFRYGSQLTHVRCEGPLEFIPSVSAADLDTARRHLQMYFHTFSHSEGAYIPNSHLARRFQDGRWHKLEAEDESGWGGVDEEIPM